jgi:tetratricopeptide (TPR) repeat protein
MIEPTNTDQLQTLVNALRQPGFRFILIEYNHLSIYDDVRKLLAEKYPEQHQYELRVSGNDYHSLTEQINEAGEAWIMIPDFDLLFTPEYESVCTAFNQRRDFFARNNVVLICFILEGNLKQVPVKIPDFWSLRSLELSLRKNVLPNKNTSIPRSFGFDKTTFGGKSDNEKKDEIRRLLNQVKNAESTNIFLLKYLYAQLGYLLYDISDFTGSLRFLKKLLKLSIITGDKQKEASTLNNIGLIYKSMGDLNKALHFFERCLKIRKEIMDESGLVITLANLALTSIDKKINHPKKAVKYLLECAELNKKIQNPEIVTAFKEMGFTTD